MKFRKIVAVDRCGLTGPFLEKILSLSDEEPVLYDSLPSGNAEIIQRISDADCVLVSWNTKLNGEVIGACPGVKYIGMCCSLYDEASANVDIAAARQWGITVKGVRDYGDNGTVEFIFAELISLYKWLGPHRWGEEPTELSSKTIGIIGMGVLGEMVARTALHFGMTPLYFSRTRKSSVEERGVEYAQLHDLLSRSDVVTTHLPRNTVLLDDKAFVYMKPEAVYINTSLGEPFCRSSLLNWLGRNSGNFAIFDAAGYGTLKETFETYPNIILFDRSSGFTAEARGRLTEKVWQNMAGFLSGSNRSER